MTETVNQGQAYFSHLELGERIRAGTLLPQLGALQHGDHLCSFYESAREQLALVVPFIRQALQRGEACLYVADDRRVAEITQMLQSAGVDTVAAREQNALVFIDKWQWRNRGDFSVPQMLRNIRDLLHRSLAPGFSGLWVAVDMTCALSPDVSSEDLAQWESLLNMVLRDTPVVLLCQYNRMRLPSETLHRQLRTHPMVVVTDRVYPNSFYEPPDIYMSGSASTHRLNWMFDQLRMMSTLEDERARRYRVEVLLREVHHHVKNSLQIAANLLSLQAGKVDDPTSQAILLETEGRIRTIAEVHANLYTANGEAVLDFGRFLREVLPSRLYEHSAAWSRVALEIAGPELLLGSEEGLPCALIVNELVANALKYAFPEGRTGTIRIQVSPEAGEAFSLTVRDDGVGFPKHLDFRKAESLGLQLVNALTRQLHGTLEMERGKGTTFRIKVPARHQQEADYGGFASQKAA